MAGARIFILTDLEGATLVTRWDQTRAGEATPESLRQARSMLTGDVNAVIDGILDEDPEAEIVVWDGHGCGGINSDEFHPRAWLIPRGPTGMAMYLLDKYDAMFFVGQHAMANTEGAVLCHTYSSTTVEYHKLNGRYSGEFSEHAYMAGEAGIPVVFISGDDKAVAEAQQVVPGIVGAAVKRGVDRQVAICMGEGLARELLREKAREAAGLIGEIEPSALEGPYEHEVRVTAEGNVQKYEARGYKIVDAFTAVKRAETLRDLFSYWRLQVARSAGRRQTDE